MTRKYNMDYQERMKRWREGKNEWANKFQKGFNNEDEDKEESSSESDEESKKIKEDAFKRLKMKYRSKDEK